jgi:hypothetical protein
MRYLIGFLPVLACAGVMYDCFRMMSMSHHGAPELDERVRELEEEVARLRAEREDATRTLGV